MVKISDKKHVTKKGVVKNNPRKLSGREFENDYFKRREQLHNDINDYRRRKGIRHVEFSTALGLRMARMDIEWWAHYIEDPAKKKLFISEANKLIKGKTFSTGMDVPRGPAMEHLYYRIAKGYTDAQYGAHANSYN